MHSSQNEQDSRFYGKFAMIPVLEPSSQQEAYDMMKYAFELSESLMAPILLRITTRMAHSRAVVEVGERVAQNELHYPEDPMRWVLLPVTARRRYNEVIAQQSELLRLAEESKYNLYHEGADKRLGVIASGIAWNYLNENFPNGLYILQSRCRNIRSLKR